MKAIIAQDKCGPCKNLNHFFKQSKTGLLLRFLPVNHSLKNKMKQYCGYFVLRLKCTAVKMNIKVVPEYIIFILARTGHRLPVIYQGPFVGVLYRIWLSIDRMSCHSNRYRILFPHIYDENSPIYFRLQNLFEIDNSNWSEKSIHIHFEKNALSFKTFTVFLITLFSLLKNWYIHQTTPYIFYHVAKVQCKHVSAKEYLENSTALSWLWRIIITFLFGGISWYVKLTFEKVSKVLRWLKMPPLHSCKSEIVKAPQKYFGKTQWQHD